MVRNLIIYKNSQIRYLKIGDGSQPVFCFHGFGEDASLFGVLQGSADSCTLLAIDLPFHGDSQWNEGYTVELIDIYAIMNAISLQENFDFKVKYTLLGFSLGGRIALALFEKYYSKINRLILVAPDGLKVNFWYYLATQTSLGNRFFAFTMKNPRWFLKIIRFLENVRFINAGVAKFVRLYLHDENMRKQLYTVWTAYKNFRPSLNRIKKLIIVNNTPLRLFYGKYDKVISYERGAEFIKGLENNAEILVVDAGHVLVTQKNSALLAQLLTD